MNLVEVCGGPAVEAALVRQQVVELLDRHLEARHVGWLSCLDPLVLLFVLHAGGFGSVRRRRDGGVGLQGGGGFTISCKTNDNQCKNIRILQEIVSD